MGVVVDSVDDVHDFLTGKTVVSPHIEKEDLAPEEVRTELTDFIQDSDPEFPDVVARYLRKVDAFMTGTFELSNGGTSDYYVDARRTWEYPLGRILGGEALARTAEEEIVPDGYGDSVIGFGIPTEGMYASMKMAEQRGWRQGYVREGKKEYGTGQAVETVQQWTDNPGEHIKLVADGVTTTGTSLAEGIKTLRNAGFGEDGPAIPGPVYGVVLVDRKEGAEERLHGINSDIYSVFTPDDIRSA